MIPSLTSRGRREAFLLGGIAFFFFLNIYISSPVIQEGICFGVSTGQQILRSPTSYPILDSVHQFISCENQSIKI